MSEDRQVTGKLDIWDALSKVYNIPDVPEEAKSIIGDVMLCLPSAQPEDKCSECDAWNQYKNYPRQPEIIRCKDCRWGKEVCGNIECFTDTNVPPEYHGYEWFCPNGERRTDGEIIPE